MRSLRIYDTLTRSKVEVEQSKEFRMFVCGPTVQDNTHLGHAKTYLAFDVLARWLLKRGKKVFFLLNITDIDDKIFNRAREENTTYTEIADRFYSAFVEDIEALNIVTVSKFERVSRHVEDSASLVKQLLTSGKAYSIHGNVFFDTSKAVDFGKLSHQSARDLRLKQIDPAPGKKSGVDFLLWRSVIDDEEVKWQTEFGAGRPGWHIEDTAIAFSEFGGPYNLHGGATELIFPHHESELAQDEAISGQVPFVKIWMHTGLLYKGNEKMSKSLGNVVTIKQALKKYTPDEIRYHFLKHHYREQLNYDPKSMDRSKEEFTVVREASSLASKEGARKEPTDIAWMEFAQNMDDDLHTPKALALLVETSKAVVDTKDEKLGGVFWNMIETLGFNLF